MMRSDVEAPDRVTVDPAAPLTPSELIYLNGEQFAKKVRIGNIELLNGEKVAADQLGQAIMAAAFLANEAAGAIRLEVRDKKTLFGLRTVKALYAEPMESVDWPEGSLEARIRPIAIRLSGDKPRNEVSDILYEWMQEDAPAPWLWAAQLIRQGMAERGLLEKVSEKKMKLFTVARHALPESTSVLAAELPLEPIRALLDNCRQSRPEVWKLLENNIKSAISRRKEADDSDLDFD